MRTRQQAGEKLRDVGVVPDDQKILIPATVREKTLKVAEAGLRRKRIRHQDLRLIPHLRSYQGCCLKASLERTGDDQVELQIQRIQNDAQLQAVPLAVFIERAFAVEDRIGPSLAG
jgi:hypothetical protein